MTLLHDTSAWLDSLVGPHGELHGTDEQELYCRIQLDNLPLLMFHDPEEFSKWVIALDEREAGKTIHNCYWLDSGFVTMNQAVQWVFSKFGHDVTVNYVGKIQLHSPIH